MFSFFTDEETLVLYSLGKFPKVPKTLNDRHKILNCLAGQKNTWEMEQWLTFLVLLLFRFVTIGNPPNNSEFQFNHLENVVIKIISGGSDGKESACNEGNLGSVPGLGRSPREGHGKPL